MKTRTFVSTFPLSTILGSFALLWSRLCSAFCFSILNFTTPFHRFLNFLFLLNLILLSLLWTDRSSIMCSITSCYILGNFLCIFNCFCNCAHPFKFFLWLVPFYVFIKTIFVFNKISNSFLLTSSFLEFSVSYHLLSFFCCLLHSVLLSYLLS